MGFWAPTKWKVVIGWPRWWFQGVFSNLQWVICTNQQPPHVKALHSNNHQPTTTTEEQRKSYSERGLNPRPSACKADVITTTLSELWVASATFYTLVETINQDTFRIRSGYLYNLLGCHRLAHVELIFCVFSLEARRIGALTRAATSNDSLRERHGPHRDPATRHSAAANWACDALHISWRSWTRSWS